MGVQMGIDFKGGYVVFTIGDRALHIVNDYALRYAINQGALYDIAARLKAEYKREKGVELQITTHSLAIEILGHVDAGKLAAYASKVGIDLNKISKSSEVVDAGELAVDGNRWVWDTISTVLAAGVALGIRV